MKKIIIISVISLVVFIFPSFVLAQNNQQDQGGQQKAQNQVQAQEQEGLQEDQNEERGKVRN